MPNSGLQRRALRLESMCTDHLFHARGEDFRFLSADDVKRMPWMRMFEAAQSLGEQRFAELRYGQLRHHFAPSLTWFFSPPCRVVRTPLFTQCLCFAFTECLSGVPCEQGLVYALHKCRVLIDACNPML